MPEVQLVQHTAHFTLDLSAASANTIWIPIMEVAGAIRRRLLAIYGIALSADSTGLWLAERAPTEPTGGSPIANISAARICTWSTASILYSPATTGMGPIFMYPGWVLGTFNTANAGDSARYLKILYADEVWQV